MKSLPTRIPEVLLIEPRVFGDARGFFFESFNAKAFADATGIATPFVQDNHSKSVKGVLRGLHYQLPPKAQGKLVRVIQGEVFDVAVDIRPDSSTYGQWVAEVLSAENKKQLWIPPGFAHGFLTLSETAEFLYKTTDYWSPEHERAIMWDDATLNIPWPLNGMAPTLAAKDAAGQSFNNAAL
ncbi:MAG: dTDP-4-dehydrorhamnose 3,5-epimerase [Fluviibacter sp.]|jgi:dTDP-4-dehydrorhamnose 3,5-epimerase